MAQYRYHCSGSDMSVSLKAMVAETRKKKPEYFVTREVRQESSEGLVVARDSKATAMDGRKRHELSMRRWGG